MSFKTWTQEHETLWEFIKFQVLSNISTATRFICTWIGTALFCLAGGVFYLVISPIHEARIRNEAMR